MITCDRDTVMGLEGSILIQDGVLSEEGEMVFTEGDCWALAWHMADLLGTPEALRTLGDRDCWQHVVVQVGEDQYVDGVGVWTASQLRKQWHFPLYAVPVEAGEDWEQYRSYLGHFALIYPAYVNEGLVREVARCVLEHSEGVDYRG